MAVNVALCYSYRNQPARFPTVTMPTRRLDDHIRKLCAEIAQIPASGPISPKVEATLQELLKAIHEKTERLRNLAATQLLQSPDQNQKPRKERRHR